jgi:hypothetical protein
MMPLYPIEELEAGAFTDVGVGIPQRHPRLTDEQRAQVRRQLANGACVAAFFAGVSGNQDPGLKPFEPRSGAAQPWLEAEAWAAVVERRKRAKAATQGRR